MYGSSQREPRALVVGCSEGINLWSTAVRPNHKHSTPKIKLRERSSRKTTHLCSHHQPLRIHLSHFHPAPPPPPHPRQLSSIQKPYVHVIFTPTTNVLPFIWRLQITGSLSSVIFWRAHKCQNLAEINHASVPTLLSPWIVINNGSAA